MKFWDASAIVPLLVAEPTSPAVQALAGRDPEMLVWCVSEVECGSALARLERAAALDVKAASFAFERLKQVAAGWHEVEPTEIVRDGHPISSRSSAASERRPSACGRLHGCRTPPGVASDSDPRRASRRRRAPRGL